MEQLKDQTQIENCNGCTTEPACDNIFKDKDRINCPCRICLVKVMCGDSCEEYGEFWHVRRLYEFERAKV